MRLTSYQLEMLGRAMVVAQRNAGNQATDVARLRKAGRALVEELGVAGALVIVPASAIITASGQAPCGSGT